MIWRGTPDEGVVRSAASIVANHADRTDDEAIAKLVDKAAALSRTVADTARLVVAGVISFDN